MAVAKFLEQNPRVEKVVYPGTVSAKDWGRRRRRKGDRLPCSGVY